MPFACTKACLWMLVTVLLSFTSVELRAIERAEPHERLVISTSGDSFAIISLREFGTTGFARLIAEYNNLAFETVLSAGQVIRIPISAALDAESASVIFSKGDPLVMPRGNRQGARDIAIGDKIYADDIVKTTQSGFVSLRFPTGTVVNIQPNSLVQLLELDCLEGLDTCLISLDAQKGGLTSNVRQREAQPTRFRVRTPHASAAVRGTVFDVDASDEKMLLGVTEGTVDVTAQGRSTDVLQGLGIRTRAGQQSDPLIQLLPEPNFRREPARLSIEDTLSWFALDDAERYILGFARDRDGATLPFNVETTALTLRMQPLPAGEYFALLRGVDAEGFKGFVTQLPIVVADIDDGAFVPELSTITENGETRLNVSGLPDSVAEYEVQLSYRADFLEPSSVDVPFDGGVLVAPVEITSYFRARSIVDATTVGRFGPVLAVPAR